MLAGDKEERGSQLKNILIMAHTVLFWFLVTIYTLAFHASSYIIPLFIRNEDKKVLFHKKWATLWGTLIVNCSFVRVKVSGLENIPTDTSVIFAPNHQSFFDIFILLKYLPEGYNFVIMRKLFDMPVIGHNITKAGFLSLDRKDKKKSITMINHIIDLLKDGTSIMIFPEGKLTKDGSVGPFGRGTSMIIQHSRKPVVPIAIDGDFDVMPKGSWKIKAGEVSMKIGKPVLFEKYYDEINKDTSMELAEELRSVVVNLKG